MSDCSLTSIARSVRNTAASQAAECMIMGPDALFGTVFFITVYAASLVACCDDFACYARRVVIRERFTGL